MDVPRNNMLSDQEKTTRKARTYSEKCVQKHRTWSWRLHHKLPPQNIKNYQSFGWFWYPHCRPLSIGGHWGSSSTAYIHLPLSLSCLCVGFRYSECVPVLPPEHQNIIKYHHVRFLQVSSIHHLKVDASICFNSHGLCGFSNSPIFYPHRAGTSFHFGFPFDHRLSRMINGSEIRDGSNSGIPFG